jgi:TPR repeat protein
MATRNELVVIRAARAGEAAAQLTLSKQYLFGGVGLQKNITTALYWLDRAAQQNEQEAWMLIGSHVPFEVAVRAAAPLHLCRWYEHAFDAGTVQAGLVFAKLVLQSSAGSVDPAMRCKALLTLEAVAHAGVAEAQLFLVQQLRATRSLNPAQDALPADPMFSDSSPPILEKTALDWTTRAAENGVLEAQRGLAVHAWSSGDLATFLRWALPAARSIAQDPSDSVCANLLSEQDVLLLSRCATTLFLGDAFDASEIERFWVLAAQAGNRDAQFRLGLWFAKMDENGERITRLAGNCHYRKAIYWLTLAGEQGAAGAWYALARIYLKPNTGLPDRGYANAQRFLERAGEAGHCAAQFELGMCAWRARRGEDANDVQAVYWLQKAAAQSNAKARALLKKIATFAAPAPWARAAQHQFTADLASNYPFLAARIELAASFGLSCPEALLLDLNTADRRHCLLVDIRSHYGRSKRRIILIQTGEEYRTLTRIGRLFANIDCGPNGPEGNYQKRFYLFKKLFSLSDAESEAMFRSEVKSL